MDFMVKLPEINAFNALLVIVDKLGKLLYLEPCRSGERQLTAPEFAKLFFENWVRFFGILKVVLHDCDARFTYLTWTRSPEHVSPARVWYRHHRAVHTASALDRDLIYL